MVDSVYHMQSFTLTQASRALAVPQHRLIHLCEKRVVVPDVRDARGRGTSREFSKRNLFEFAIAVEMRRLELPVSFIQAVLRVLRSFETEAAASIAQFVLPDSLVAPGSPQLTLIIVEGERLYFRLEPEEGASRVFGGIDIRHPRARGRARRHQGIGRLEPTDAEKVLGAARTRTEIDLSRIAGDLAARLPHD
jgi:hypothetical protein